MKFIQCAARLIMPLAVICGSTIIAAEPHSQPNIVVIYADDLGYGDVSCYNPDRGKIATPNIDRLADEGMLFTDAHSSSAVCSPSRYTLLTGRYHWRTRLQSGIVGLYGKPLIAANTLTVAGLLQRNGYQTACIGKWHLGWDWPIQDSERSFFAKAANNAIATTEHRTAWRAVFARPIANGPTTRGFDQYFGTDVPNWPPYCFIENDRTMGFPSEFLSASMLGNNQASRQGPAIDGWTLERILPTLADRSVEFIAAAAKNPKPYFLYVPLTAPHTPLAVNDSWIGKSGLGQYADFVMETDAVVGRVIDAIGESGQADRTLVIFTSDNGCAPYIGVKELEEKGHFASGPLRGYKADVWEGGHRVPFIVRWPGVVETGSRCEQLVHQADLMATFARVIDVVLPPDAGVDSFSLVPLLKGSNMAVRETAVSQSIRGLLAVRRGRWKLIFGSGSGGWSKGSDSQPGQLYDLQADLGEQTNLYSQRQATVDELTAVMRNLVHNGRSTPGESQPNDVKVNWTRLAK